MRELFLTENGKIRRNTLNCIIGGVIAVILGIFLIYMLGILITLDYNWWANIPIAARILIALVSGLGLAISFMLGMCATNDILREIGE